MAEGRCTLDEATYGGVVANSPDAGDPLVKESQLTPVAADASTALGLATDAKALADAHEVDFAAKSFEIDTIISDQCRIRTSGDTIGNIFTVPSLSALATCSPCVFHEFDKDQHDAHEQWSMDIVAGTADYDPSGYTAYDGRGWWEFYTGATINSIMRFTYNPVIYGTEAYQKYAFLMYMYVYADPVEAKVSKFLGLVNPSNRDQAIGLRKYSATASNAEWALMSGDGVLVEESAIPGSITSLAGKHVWLGVGADKSMSVWIDAAVDGTPTHTLAATKFAGSNAAVAGLFVENLESANKTISLGALGFWFPRKR